MVRRPQFLIDSRSPSELGRAFSPLNARLSNGLTIEDAYQRAKGYEATFGPRGGKGKPALTPDFDYEGTYQALYDQFARENPDLMRQLAAVAVDADLVHPRARTTQNPAVALSRILAAGIPTDEVQQAAVPRIYAGIGSRSTPPEVLALMTPLAAAMQEQGWLLRSGGAAGADAAFEAGVSDPSRRAIYLPGRSFNGRLAGPGGYFDSTQLPGWQAALETVSRYHPAPDRLSPFARNLMARNAMQLLGPSLDRPADLVVAWTPGGQVTGGTGQALRMAADLGIEVRNLGRPEVLTRARRFLGL